MTAGLKEQIPFEGFFNRLLTVKVDVAGIAVTSHQDARRLQIQQRLVQPFVIIQAVSSSLTRPANTAPALSDESTQHRC